MNKFTLEIEMGNAAMQSADDVASALRRVADRLTKGVAFNQLNPIRDDNGNLVGHYEVTRS